MRAKIRTKWRSGCRLAIALCGASVVVLTSGPAEATKPSTPTDAEITAAIDGDLWFDSSVPTNDISVKTADGIVTLSGKVSNVLAKRRARQVTEAVRGVRGIVDTIAVVPIPRSDEDVRKDVQAALLADPATDSYAIKVDAKGGTVALTGTVQSWTGKNLAAAVAEGVKGVRAVMNQVRVVYEAKRSDAEISADVEGRLARDVWVDDRLIKVAVKDGEVVLSGAAGSLAERNRIHSDAWVAGVKSIDDGGVKVEAWAYDWMKKPRKAVIKGDDKIQQAVLETFLFDPRVMSFRPVVTVHEGVVTLTGTVDNLKAKRAAEQDATNTSGVWQVKNIMRVRDQTKTPDDKVAQGVKDALARDPYVDRYQIAVTARDGTVRLQGTVDSYYERAHAEDVASRVNGVADLIDNLDVTNPQYGYYYWPYSLYDYEPPYYHAPQAGKTWPYKTDAQVKADAKEQMFWSPFVDAKQVKVAVKNGVATLTVTVDSWQERFEARQNAIEAGALMVINDLTVAR